MQLGVVIGHMTNPDRAVKWVLRFFLKALESPVFRLQEGDEWTMA
jgi:hypothetical protein